MEESNLRIALIEKTLRSGDPNTQDPADLNKLCDIIRQTSFEIHKFFRSGHLEKIYENALAHRLTKFGSVETHDLLTFVLFVPFCGLRPNGLH